MSDKKRKRIALIGSKSFPSQAGVDRVVEAIARGLADRNNYEITIYGDKGKLDPTKTPPNIKLIPIQSFGPKHFRAFSQFSIAALHALFRGNYDLVHLHNLEAAYLLPLLRLKYPVITTSHVITHRRVDQWGHLARFLIRLMEWPFIHLSNACTAVSYMDSQYYQHKHDRQVEWIPNGVELSNEIPPTYRRDIIQKHGLDQDEYILFVAGRIIPTKGAHILLSAAKQMDALNTYPIVILGDLSRDPEYAKQLQNIAPENTRFIPFIRSKREVEAIISEATLLVFPSMVEGMSMVLLESVAQKTQIVVSNIPENKSVLQENALYFHSEDIDDLAEKLIWALENPKQIQALADGAYQHVLTEFNWDRIVSSYVQCYRHVVDN